MRTPPHCLPGSALILVAASLLALLAAACSGDIGVRRRAGLGLVAGSAPGLTGKVWTSPKQAVDFGLGIGHGDFACSRRFNPCGERTSFNLDYLWHPGRSSSPGNVLGMHAGLGARLWFYDYGRKAGDMDLAARIPLGLDLYLLDTVEVYAEVAPSLILDPNDFFVEGAVGGRLYF